jgi:hypothetical protein
MLASNSFYSSWTLIGCFFKVFIQVLIFKKYSGTYQIQVASRNGPHPVGLELETITKLNDLFPIPDPVPIFCKIQFTVIEQLQKSFHILAKVYQCSSDQCRDKSVIYKIQNSVHDMLNKSTGATSEDWQEISLFKRSFNTGN